MSFTTKQDLDKSGEYHLFEIIKYNTLFSTENNFGFFNDMSRKFWLMTFLVIILCAIPVIISSAKKSKDFESGLWPCFGALSGVWTIGLLCIKTKSV